MEEALKLRKWGNSNAIRLPKEMLKQVGITPNDDEVSVNVTNDSIIIKDVDQFYIYLQKTKLNGAYSVFERINNNLGVDFGANAGVVEVQDQSFEDIKDALNAALEKACENTNSLIVASDFYTKEKNSYRARHHYRLKN